MPNERFERMSVRLSTLRITSAELERKATEVLTANYCPSSNALWLGAPVMRPGHMAGALLHVQWSRVMRGLVMDRLGRAQVRRRQ
jgi:hypothetical protein